MSMHRQAASVNERNRNYPLLLASQFLSAFGDNLILMIILGPFLTQRNTGQITEQAQSIANVFYTSILFVPYVLLAPLAGYLNDRFSKNRWLLGGNFVKVIGSAITGLGASSSKFCLALGYFIVGIGACIYSPAKYGILPEILPNERLVKANGLVELLTLVAILMGNIGGAIAYDRLSISVCYSITIAIYALSLGLNALMTRTPSYPEVQFKGSVGQFFQNIVELFSQKRLARVLAGTALFWICGAVLKMNFQPWGQQVLKLQSMTAISLLGLWLSIGVMAGSVLAGQLYKIGDLRAARRYGWLLAAGIALLGGIGSFLKAGLDHPMWLAVPILMGTGLIAGLFLIPLNAALQAESHKDRLGKTIATQNGLENLAMLGGAVIAFLDIRIGFNPSELLLALAAFVSVVVIWLKIPGRVPIAEKVE
jgi:MFS transporter, LPLT family, lysophospholipid transporter